MKHLASPIFDTRFALRATLLCLWIVVASLSAGPALATDATDAAEIAAGLRDVASKLDQLAGFEAFGESLPLVTGDPTALLDLDEIFNASLGTLPGAYTDLADLAQALDSADLTLPGGATISFDNVTVTRDGTMVDVRFDIAVSHPGLTLPVQATLLSGPVDTLLEGGDLPLDIGFSLPDMTFQLDGDLADVGDRFYLSYGDLPPAVSLPIAASGSTSFSAALGFTEVSVAPSIQIDVDISAQLNDPDSDGRITLSELQTTAVEDLFTVAYNCDAADDLTASLVVTSDLVSTPSTISYSDNCLIDGLDAPTYNWSDILNFSYTSPTNVLQGLSVLAATINGAQNTKDLPIPFLRQGLSSVFSFAEPVTDFVEGLGQAAIICGPLAEDPPRGNLLDVPGGELIYCQAISIEQPTAVTWRVESGGAGELVTAGDAGDLATDLQTVGTNPVKNAVFRTPAGGGLVDVEVEFTDSTGTHVVKRRFLSAQEMAERLIELAGFEDVADLMTYDEDNDTLSFHLRKSFNPDAQTGLSYNFADLLRGETNLISLTETSGASVSIDPGQVTVDVVFGVVLREDPDPLLDPAMADAADPISKDRFFVAGAPGGGPELYLDGLSADANVDLTGLIGFVEVTAQGDDDPGPGLSGSGFNLGAADTGPVLALDLDLPGIDDLGTTIPDAIRFRQLLRELGRVQPVFNLAMSGGLSVAATVGEAPQLFEASGHVDLAWEITDPNAIGSPTVNADVSFTDNLKAFDIDPALTGTHTGPDLSQNGGIDHLIDATQADFATADLINSTLRNVTDGSQCIVQSGAAGASGITCDLSGGTLNSWSVGDRYEVGGDPFALLRVVLDNMDLILAGLETTGALDEEIPLVGRTPRQLLSALETVRDELQTFRTQQPAAQVMCSAADASGNALGLPPIGLTAGSLVVCQGVQLTAVPAAVQWSISGAGASVSAGGDDGGTVFQVGQSPDGTYAEFFIADGGSLGDDFKIELAMIADDGLERKARLPVMPLTLQNLTTLISDHLGLPEGLLSLKIEDLPLPGTTGADGTPDLVVGLSYGLCTDKDGALGVAELACMDGDRVIDAPTASVRLELPEEFTSELVSVDTAGPEIRFDLRAGARLDVGIPLALDFDPSATTILDTSGLFMAAAGNLDGLSITGNVGPLRLQLDGEAGFGLALWAAAAETPTGAPLATAGFPGSLAPYFGSLSTPPNCGEVTPSTTTAMGSHDGTDGATHLTDTTMTFDATYVGLTLRNRAEGSSCEITAVSASGGDSSPLDTLECTLAGGTLNTWGAADDYVVEGPGTPIALDGDVCARLGLGLDVLGETVDIGDLGFRIETLAGNVPRLATDSLDDPADWFVSVPTSLFDNISVRDLDLTLLLSFLPTVLDNIAAAMASGESVPLIGGGLSDLGNAIDKVNMDVIEPLVTTGLELASTTVPDLETEIETFIWDSLPQAGRDLLPDGQAGIVVTGYCELDPLKACNPTDEIGSLQDIRLRMVLGQFGEPDPDNPGTAMPGSGSLEPQQTLDIDMGIDGLPLRLAGGLDVSYGWRLPIEIGLSRQLGPYVQASDTCPPTAAGSGTALRIGAAVRLKDDPSVCDLDDPNSFDGIPTGLEGFADGRCVFGRLGFLDVNLRDSDDNPTGVDLFAFTKLKSSGTSDSIPIAQLLSSGSLEAGISGQANVDLRFRTGLAFSAAAELPSVLGTFALDAGYAVSTDGSTPDNGVRNVAFDNLYLDVGQFFGRLIGPAVGEVQRVTKPLTPVIDTARAPLPVVSDLAEAVGQDPITLLTLIELQNGPGSTKLIDNLFALIDFVNSLPADSGGVILIPLGDPTLDLPGAFVLDLDQMAMGASTPSDAGKLIDFNPPDPNLKPRSANVTSAVSSTIPGEGKAFGVPGLSFPFLDNSSQIFGLLMGEDITLVRYDAGTLQASAGFQYTYGPFLVGPVPVEVTLGGSATLQARFAMGYDTSGIRKALEGSFSGSALFDGIFIDDLDASGSDVPEISLIGEVSAGAGVSLGIVAAGIRGGVSMTTSLNLDDRPEPDGKLKIEEIVNKLHNPLCLFVVEGKLEAFLSGWVRVGIEWFSKEWDIEFVRVTLLEFEIACTPPPPVLAQVGTDRVVLNVGNSSRREARGLQPDRIDEKIVIRQDGARLWSITGFGLTQTYGPPDSDFPIPGSGTVTFEIDAHDGNDDIAAQDGVERLPGADGVLGTEDDEDRIVVFDAHIEICGGAGADSIKTAGGTDTIYGDSGGSWCESSGDDGNDRISSGASGDTIFGEGGDDVLVAEGGADTVRAGAGNDMINGGPGADHLYGDADNDNINGGGPATQAFGTNAEDPTLDDGDVIEGGLGDDVIDGNYGDDVIYGDVAADAGSTGSACGVCVAGTAAGGLDRIIGGPGNDSIWGGNNPAGTKEPLGGDSGNDFICGGGGDDLIDGDDDLPHTLDGADVLHGGPGADGIWGRGGNDRICGDAANDELLGGDGFDDLIGGDGRDLLFGDEGNDLLIGDTGAIGSPTPAGRGSELVAPLDAGFLLSSVTRTADSGAIGPVIEDCFLEGGEYDVPRIGTENGSADCLFGGPGHDLLFGENGADQIYGDSEDDFAEGGAGADLIRGGQGRDVIYGHRRIGDSPWREPPTAYSSTSVADGDFLFGDSGFDLLFGGPDSDEMRGGIDDDYLEGNQDGTTAGDFIYGDGGQDDLIGGSSLAGIDDGVGDTLVGNTGHDVIVADNGKITRNGDANDFDGSWVRQVVLLDLETIGGADEVAGNQGNDRLWGGFGNDVMSGGPGDDSLAGNPGADRLFGNAGQDDLIGGTGRTTILTGRTVIANLATAVDGRDDGVDHIFGGDGVEDSEPAGDFDVILGDNGVIDRPVDEEGQWIVNTFNAGVSRDVWLLDVAVVGSPAGSATAGGDVIAGEADDDLIWGQGGDDTIEGGDGDDLMQGNAGSDIMAGGTGNDDLIGGTGRINDDPETGLEGRYDGGDQMDGGPGFDVMAGDNAILDRVLTAGAWTPHTFDEGLAHEPRILLDVDSVSVALVAGRDTMNGNEDNDYLYGQGDRDLMHGNGGDDFMEGNADDDEMYGDGGEDDLIGGTVSASVGDGGDLMQGNDMADVMLGDNGRITRPLDGAGQWTTDPNTGAVIRQVVLLDVETVTTAVNPAYSDGDEMHGNGGPDRLFGQGGNDLIHGNEGVDVAEGNHGDDRLFGDEGEDDLIGGGSAADGVIADGSIGDGLTDGDDVLRGGDEGDVIAGDNARITRPVDNAGLWINDPNVDDAFRAVTLFDVEVVGAVIADAASGSDTIYGESGRDLLFGQGNGDPADDDSDLRFSEDPVDGVDNDHDGREGIASLGYDCADGVDNDGDGLEDLADPDCLVAIDEDGGGDELHGGPGVDYVEGNHGSDLIFGDDGEDDLIGGSSAGDGIIGGGVPPTALADGHDVISGGPEDDVIVADNAVIVRPTDNGGLWQRIVGGSYDQAVRETTMSEAPEPEGAFGHDFAIGNDAQDEIYGQQGDDYLEGNFGDDALVGDLGQVTTTFEDGSRTTTIEGRSPFLVETIYETGTLSRLTELYAFVDGDGAEGHDVMLGGDGDDNLHAGPGDDIVNGDGDGIPTLICDDPSEDPISGTVDEDHIFGGDGADALWGGRGTDHLFGGYGDDALDIKPRAATDERPADPPEWFTWGEPDNNQGFDFMYGGWDRDAMQADLGGPGPVDGDRMVDWSGAYNAYFVCPAALGAGYIQRLPSPFTKRFFEDLAAGDGAFRPKQAGSSGHRELALVDNPDISQNSHPPHPDHPTHFVCACDDEGGGEPTTAECGNGVCEPGEDCESCEVDCAGKSNGPPSGRFCCGDGLADPAEGDGALCDGNL